MAAKWVCSDDIRGRQEPVLTKASDAKDQSLRVRGLSSLAANHSGRAVLKIDARSEVCVEIPLVGVEVRSGGF